MTIRLKSISTALLAFAMFFVNVCVSYSQPQLPQSLGSTIADKGSAFYTFEKFEIESEDGQRHYLIQVGKPRSKAPSKGYQVAYLLDGNAAIAALDEEFLGKVAAGDPPVIVAIGYVGSAPFNVTARAYDYTPPVPGVATVADDAGRPGGGAELFFELIEQKIKPRIQSVAPIDRDRQTLWGHSYGGLFTLHVLFAHPESFSRYVAASPSLWWNYGAVLKEEPAFLKGPQRKRPRVEIITGELEKAHPSSNLPSGSMRLSLQPGVAKSLADRLKAAEVSATFVEHPGLGHGPMLGASLRETLLAVANRLQQKSS